MIVTGLYPVWFLYTAGPLLGGAAAGLLYRLIRSASPPSAPLADVATHGPRTRANEAYLPPTA